jgi:hypothetical protein
MVFSCEAYPDMCGAMCPGAVCTFVTFVPAFGFSPVGHVGECCFG